jgi:transcriptional/translational regulatory protein YebC/TACO1
MGFSVSTAELIQKPKSLLPIGRVDQERFLEMFDSLQAHDDVQRIYDNAVVE